MARTPDPAAQLETDRARALTLTPVSRETAERLDGLAALLLKWQATTNLVAPSTLPHLWTRHIADSLQLVPFAPDTAEVWVDLGSGGGFPGLVVAAALAERAGFLLHLVESNGKKAAFLREAVRVLGLPAQVHAVRIEDFLPRFAEPVHVISARALASLPILLGYAEKAIESGAQGLFLKGQDVEAELTDSSKYWNIEATLQPSLTDPHGRVVIVKALQRRDKL